MSEKNKKKSVHERTEENRRDYRPDLLWRQVTPDHFANVATGEEFRTGQEVSSAPGHGWGDGMQYFNITGFSVTDNDYPSKTGSGSGSDHDGDGGEWRFVYPRLATAQKEYRLRESHISDVMRLGEDPKFYDHRRGESCVIQEWRERQSKPGPRNRRMLLVD
jgi:hypothetical protein